MFQHILVPIDGGELSERAAATSLELARRLGARVTAFVAEPLPPLPNMGSLPTAYARGADQHLSRTEAHARDVLARFGAKAVQEGVSCDGRFMRSEPVDQAIVEAAREYDCDLIAKVTHGRGAFGELMFGSHTKSVMSRSKLPLLVLR
jgi:nucleotide-binding universal stress UspA family protein